MFIYDGLFNGTVKQETVQNLFNMFPVGMMIFEKITNNSSVDFELKYINETALKVFRKSNVKSWEELIKTLKKFNKLEKFSTLSEVYSYMNDVSEENLYNRIFDNLDKNETEICERYVSKDVMIYVKIKICQQYKLVSIENFNDERIAIQNNIIKNIKTQYLLTLSHELNNPLNSLAYSVNEIISTKEATKALTNSMKISMRLIKFFVKNFIFSLKMSLEMNTIILDEKNEEKKEEVCINLEYVFKKVQEKYSIFFRSKQIRLECNFNLIANIYVTYKYEYFKSLIKNIFMYLFYRVEKIGGVKVEIVFEKELKIMFKKDFNQNNPNNFLSIKTQPQINRLDTSFVNEISIESSVKTIIILNEIIHKFARMLGIRLCIIEDESPCYLIVSFKYDIDEDLSRMNKDIAEEFTNRASKTKNAMKLDRSIYFITKTECNDEQINRSFSRKNGISNTSYCVNERSVISPGDSWNLSKISIETSNKEKQSLITEGNSINNKIVVKSPKPDKSLGKISKCHSKPSNLKTTVSATPEKISNIIPKLNPNSRQNKLVARSNFSFKYFNHKNMEDGIGLTDILVIGKETDILRSKKNLLNQYAMNKKDIKKDQFITKFSSNKASQKSQNNSSKIVGYNSPGSTDSRSIKNSLNSLNIPPALKKSVTGSSKFKDTENKLSPITSLITNIHNDRSSTNIDLQKSPQTNTKVSSGIRHPDIMVVDDDSMNLDVLESMLKKLKLTCDTCMDGLECLNKLESKYAIGIEYKLILMDVMMPVMDGIQASNRIEEMIKNNKLNKNLKIIFVSAHNNRDIIDNATKLSVVAEFLPKPVKQANIQRIINQYYIK